MYFRKIITELLSWKIKSNRKPLILCGARQVGKTSVVRQFSINYAQYIYLNLEIEQDSALFKNYKSIKQLVEAIFFIKNLDTSKKENTLLFIDEIQEVPEAINLLRYFYEEYPEIHVIAAGSLSETVLSQNIKIPVGRVEFKVLRPVNFEEFLGALGEKTALEMLNSEQVPAYAHDKLMQLFNTFTLIGGMPEVIQNYAKERNLTQLNSIYESLLLGYQNEFEKYAQNSSQTQILRHILKTIGSETGNRIKFQEFGNSNYGSREVGEALRTLEKAMLIKLVYPCVSTKFPVQMDFKKSPKLQFLDTGLFNKLAGIQKELLLASNVEAVYKGKVAEHIVGQELLSSSFSPFNELKFWTKENKDSTAEVDYLFEHNGLLLPVEVKLGASGRLRSLHSFIDQATHNFGVRVCSNSFNVENHKTISGKAYKLMNMPFYLTAKLGEYANRNF